MLVIPLFLGGPLYYIVLVFSRDTASWGLFRFGARRMVCPPGGSAGLLLQVEGEERLC